MVQIDMEMPKDCMKCQFEECPLICGILKKRIPDANIIKKTRPDWCPLKEVKDDN